MMSKIYLNGEFVSPDQAHVSVLDRGFLFADAIYEVVQLYHGQPFGLVDHFERLMHSAHEIGLTVPFDLAHWRQVIATLKPDAPRASFYCQISRGACPSRAHTYNQPPTPTVVMFCQTIDKTTPLPIRAITHPDWRWQRCDIKSTALLANTLAAQYAKANGAQEALLHHEGQLTEGASSNVFVCHHNQVFTTPLSHNILPGITRTWTINALSTLGITVTIAPIALETCLNAEEVWITSTTREITPVVRIDDRWIGDGTPGPLWHRVHQAFSQLVQTELAPLLETEQ